MSSRLRQRLARLAQAMPWNTSRGYHRTFTSAPRKIHARSARWWRWCWPVVENPVAGIRVAMPLVCVQVPKVHYMGLGGERDIFMDQPSVNYPDNVACLRGRLRVRWIGYAPDHGIMLADTDWHAGYVAPEPPLVGWTTVEDADPLYGLEHRLARGGWDPNRDEPSLLRHSIVKGLQVPSRWLPMLDLPEQDMFELMRDNYARFSTHLPQGTRECVDLLSGQAQFWSAYHNRPHTGFYLREPEYEDRWQGDNGAKTQGMQGFCRALNRALGANPAPGTDMTLAGLRRRQFMLDHPVVASLAQGPFLDTLDRGLPTLPRVAERIGSSRRVAAMLLRVPAQHAGQAHGFASSLACIPMLEGMNSGVLGALPGMDSGGWLALRRLADQMHCNNAVEKPVAVGGYCNSLACTSDPRPRGGDAHAVGASLRLVDGGLGWLERDPNLWRHMRDLACNMQSELVKPALVAADYRYVSQRVLFHKNAPLERYHHPDTTSDLTRVEIVQALLLTMGVPRLARALQAHLGGLVHTARLQAEGAVQPGAAGIAGAELPQDWEVMAAEASMPGGPTLRFLSSQRELDAEGRALRHCVGSYGGNCSLRYCAILSIGHWSMPGRNPAGPNPSGPGVLSGGAAATARVWQPTSTLELVCNKEGALVVRQHMGVRNARPAPTDLRAAAWWMDQVSRGCIAIGPGVLVSRPDDWGVGHRMTPLEQVQAELGRNWMTDRAHQYRWDRWRRILDTRAACFGDYLAAMPPETRALVPQHAELLDMVRALDTVTMDGSLAGTDGQTAIGVQ